MNRSNLLLIWLFCGAAVPVQAGALLGGKAVAPKVQESTQVRQPAMRPPIVYVTDFYLDPSKVQKKTLLGWEGPLRKSLDALRGDDPESRAKKLVSALAQAITQGLREGGQPAEYLPDASAAGRDAAPGVAELPPQGWLVGGSLVSVNEGNRALAASVGLGSGAESVEIQVTVTDLARRPLEPFLFMGTGSESKLRPGGLIMGSPYAVAVKFVLSRGATESDVKKQGAAIAKGLLGYLASKQSVAPLRPADRPSPVPGDADSARDLRRAGTGGARAATLDMSSGSLG